MYQHNLCEFPEMRSLIEFGTSHRLTLKHAIPTPSHDTQDGERLHASKNVFFASSN